MKTIRSLLRGATAGAVATVAMSALMLAAKRIGITGTLPPELIARKAVAVAAGDPPREDREDAVAAVAHIGFGAIAGAAFELLMMRADDARNSAPIGASAGALYGTAIWLVSYQGWVPALGIMPAASRDRRGRVATMLAAHWVYGGALGVLGTVLRR